MKINTLRLRAAAGMMSAVMVPSAAFADYGTTPSTICTVEDAVRALPCVTTTTAEATTTTDAGTGGLGDTTTSEAAVATTVGGTSGQGDELPFTGGDIAGATLVGLGLAAGGTVLVRANRRRATA
jgi:hypothetical protein